MENELKNKYLYEIKKLPHEVQVVINNFDIDNISKEIGLKYLLSEDEIDILQNEIYNVIVQNKEQDMLPLNIENNVGVSKDESISIASEINQKIFKPMVEKISNPDEEKNKTVDDNSDHQVKIYKIGKKYDLHIDEIGIFEKIINKVISGELSSKKFNEELKSKISLSNDQLFNIINDVNQSIFKNIRDNFKSEWEERKIKNNQISTPPYKKKSNDIPVPPYKKESNNEIKQEEKDILKNSGIDIIEEKLTKPTKSKDAIHDYSLPKMSPGISTNKQKDPYREEI